MTPKGIVKSIPSSPTKVLQTREQELQMEKKRKERQLEEQLRKRYCRPLLKLFKIMSTDAFKASFADESPELAAYLENTKIKL